MLTLLYTREPTSTSSMSRTMDNRHERTQSLPRDAYSDAMPFVTSHDTHSSYATHLAPRNYFIVREDALSCLRICHKVKL